MQIVIDINDDELKAVEMVIPDLVEWTEHAVRNKIRKCLERLVAAHTVYNPVRLNPGQLVSLIAPLNLPSRRERDKAEIENRIIENLIKAK